MTRIPSVAALLSFLSLCATSPAGELETVANGAEARPSALGLVATDPYTRVDSEPFIMPAIKVLNARLSRIEDVAHARQVPVRHVFQAAYGSGFLRYNEVGNDLDYVLGIHLGELKIRQDDLGSAGELIIERLEKYLQVFHEVTVQMSSPELAVMSWRNLDEEGSLSDRAVVLKRLIASLQDATANRPHAMMVTDYDGRRFANVVPAGDACIYLNTRIKMISNQISYTDWMYSGLREFSVMFDFFIDLEIEDDSGKVVRRENMGLAQTFLPAGKIIPFSDYYHGTASVGEASAEFLTEELPSAKDRLPIRIARATDMFNSIDYHLGKDEFLKTLKRIHQIRDYLEPAFEPAFVQRIDRLVENGLKHEDVLLCEEIAEMAEMARYAVRDFHAEGHLLPIR